MNLCRFNKLSSRIRQRFVSNNMIIPPKAVNFKFGSRKFRVRLVESSLIFAVLLTDVLHGCLINYVIKSQRDGLENFEIINTSRRLLLLWLITPTESAFCQIFRCKRLNCVFLQTSHWLTIEKLQKSFVSTITCRNSQRSMDKSSFHRRKYYFWLVRKWSSG